jgi:hypothetical protein
MSDTLTCPNCAQDWPVDRFNGVDPNCFRCRSKTIGVSFGPGGKSQFHGQTHKEIREETVRMSRANGLDPVPVHSAGVSVAASTMKKLETASV